VSCYLVPSPEVDGATGGGAGGFVDLGGGQEVEADAGERIAGRSAGAQVRQHGAGGEIPHRHPRIHRRAHHHDFSYGRQLAPSTDATPLSHPSPPHLAPSQSATTPMNPTLLNTRGSSPSPPPPHSPSTTTNLRHHHQTTPSSSPPSLQFGGCTFLTSKTHITHSHPPTDFCNSHDPMQHGIERLPKNDVIKSIIQTFIIHITDLLFWSYHALGHGFPA
jgi:hypothetical protein